MDKQEIMEKCRILRLETAQCDYSFHSNMSRAKTKKEMRQCIKEWKNNRRVIFKEIRKLEREARKLKRKELFNE